MFNEFYFDDSIFSNDKPKQIISKFSEFKFDYFNKPRELK